MELVKARAAMLIGSVEFGGTKVRCAVGTGPGDLREELSVPTGSPETTLNQVVSFFIGQAPVTAIGVGCFGPVDRNPDSDRWGSILDTPKAGWSNIAVADVLSERLRVPIAFDTDVAAALAGEVRWGAARGARSAVYLTVGTGIGGAAMVDGHGIGGRVHPEMGHVPVPIEPDDPLAEGTCPFHDNCLEGRASGPSVAARWQCAGEDLSDEHPAWDLEARYLAHGIQAIGLVVAPDRIVLGGGLGLRDGLIDLIGVHLASRLRGYGGFPSPDTWLVPAGLGQDAGLLGGFAMAMALNQRA